MGREGEAGYLWSYVPSGDRISGESRVSGRGSLSGGGYPDGIYLHSRIYPTSQINPIPRDHKGGQYASYWNASLLILISLTQENSKNPTQIQGPNSNELNI